MLRDMLIGGRENGFFDVVGSGGLGVVVGVELSGTKDGLAASSRACASQRRVASRSGSHFGPVEIIG